MRLRIVFLMMLCTQASAFDVRDMEKLSSGHECTRCDLSQTDLSNATLSGVDLKWVNLTRTNLSSADLRGADLKWANLSGTDLTNADLTGAFLNLSLIHI